jgi:hypothetical protein
MEINENLKEATLTFGEKLVGISFNPSGDERVNKVKKICAELMDILYSDIPEDGERTYLQDTLFNKSVGDILDAQMTAVKLLTLKH